MSHLCLSIPYELGSAVEEEYLCSQRPLLSAQLIHDDFGRSSRDSCSPTAVLVIKIGLFCSLEQASIMLTKPHIIARFKQNSV